MLSLLVMFYSAPMSSNFHVIASDSRGAGTKTDRNGYKA